MSTPAPLDAADLKVNHWIDQAVLAGMNPLAMIGPGGERSLLITVFDCDEDFAPSQHLTDGARLAIIEGLVARGRAVNTGTP